MKSSILLLVLVAVFAIGCSSTTPQIQSVDQYGTVSRNTIKITKDEEQDDFVLRFALSKNRDESLNTLVDGHTAVNKEGYYEVEPVEGQDYYIERADVNEYKFEGNNFHWSLPELQTNFEFEYNVLSTMAIYGGTSFAKSGEHDLFGYNFGIGFFREENNWAIRFDATGTLNEMLAEVEYVCVEDIVLSGDRTREVYFFNESSEKKFINLNLGVTINTRNSNWFVNGFMNYTLGWQDFYDIDTQPVYSSDIWENDNLTYDESYHSLAVGLYKDIETLGKLIAGTRFTKYMDSKDRLFIPDYFLQFDFELF